MDFTTIVEPRLTFKIFANLDIKSKFRLLRVNRGWRRLATEVILGDGGTPVWIYVIFRRTSAIGDDRIVARVNPEGPMFWQKQVIYFNCCSCHFASKHLVSLLGLCGLLATKIDRLCLVDKPVNHPFLPDSFVQFIVNKMINLKFLYLRELDLCYINFPTALAMAVHPTLKKVVVHNCVNYDTLKDFQLLPQLMVVNGSLNADSMMGEFGNMEFSPAKSPAKFKRM